VSPEENGNLDRDSSWIGFVNFVSFVFAFWTGRV